MKLYRLKKEAVPFFNEKCATKILDLKAWKEYNVEEKVLEEVEDAVVHFGYKKGNCTNLCGWCANDNDNGGASFHFTIRFPSLKLQEYDEFSNGKIVRELMDRIQQNVSWFYNDYKSDNSND